jgi:hypothetical protein
MGKEKEFIKFVRWEHKQNKKEEGRKREKVRTFA